MQSSLQSNSDGDDQMTSPLRGYRFAKILAPGPRGLCYAAWPLRGRAAAELMPPADTHQCSEYCSEVCRWGRWYDCHYGYHVCYIFLGLVGFSLGFFMQNFLTAAMGVYAALDGTFAVSLRLYAERPNDVLRRASALASVAAVMVVVAFEAFLSDESTLGLAFAVTMCLYISLVVRQLTFLFQRRS